MLNEIDEPIQVEATFSGTGLRPLWFTWKGRRYKIKEVTYTWGDSQGKSRLYYFSASDGVNLYELCFNAENLTWRLNRIYCEG